jgi:hypothetical protein
MTGGRTLAAPAGGPVHQAPLREQFERDPDAHGPAHGRGRWERLRRPPAWLLASDLAFRGFKLAAADVSAATL